MNQVKTIKGISCYGSITNADYLIVCDEMEEHYVNNWNHKEDRKFYNWREAVSHLLSLKWYGEIQEIGAE